VKRDQIQFPCPVAPDPMSSELKLRLVFLLPSYLFIGLICVGLILLFVTEQKNWWGGVKRDAQSTVESSCQGETTSKTQVISNSHFVPPCLRSQKQAKTGHYTVYET
jgi:hypothetical protein